MAQHNTVFRGPETQEAFYAEKLRFWGGVNKASIGVVVATVLLLIAMVVLL